MVLMAFAPPGRSEEVSPPPAVAPESADATRMPTILVTGERPGEDPLADRRDSPTTRIVIGREQVQRYNDATVGEVLRRLPGVSYSGPPGVVKDIRMRGADKGFTQILIDGQRIAGSGKEQQVQVDRLPADLIERIEIVRVPTAEMDSRGIAGTVNIVLRQAPDKTTGGVRAAAGRLGDADVGDYSASFGSRHGGFGYLVTGSYADRAEELRDEKIGFNADGTVKDSTIEDKPADIRD